MTGILRRLTIPTISVLPVLLSMQWGWATFVDPYLPHERIPCDGHWKFENTQEMPQDYSTKGVLDQGKRGTCFLFAAYYVANAMVKSEDKLDEDMSITHFIPQVCDKALREDGGSSLEALTALRRNGEMALGNSVVGYEEAYTSFRDIKPPTDAKSRNEIVQCIQRMETPETKVKEAVALLSSAVEEAVEEASRQPEDKFHGELLIQLHKSHKKVKVPNFNIELSHFSNLEKSFEHIQSKLKENPNIPVIVSHCTYQSKTGDCSIGHSAAISGTRTAECHLRDGGIISHPQVRIRNWSNGEYEGWMDFKRLTEIGVKFGDDYFNFISISPCRQKGTCKGGVKGKYEIHYLLMANDEEGLQALLNVKGESKLKDSKESHAPAIQNGPFDINLKDWKGRTPLYRAVIIKKPTQVNTLIAHGANVNIPDDDGDTPLHLAAIQKTPHILEILLAAGAKLDLQDKKGFTPLHASIMEGAETTFNTLLERKANFNIADVEGDTPLHKAVSENRIAMAKRLSAIVPSINVINKAGNTPLHLAVISNQLELVRVFATHGADLNAKNLVGKTPLQIAMESGAVALAEELISRGANLNKMTPEKRTPFHLALSRREFEGTRRLMLEGKIDLSIKDPNMNSYLHAALSIQDFGTARTLIQKRKTLIYEIDQNGDYPIHQVIRQGNAEMATYLLSIAPDLIGLQNRRNETALHLAAQSGQTELYKLLVEKVPKLNKPKILNKKNIEGKTAGQLIEDIKAFEL